MIKNFLVFIGQKIVGATVGAPLSADTNGNIVSGISNTEVVETANATTTSTSAVLMSTMTITPAAGTYMVFFSTYLTVSATAQVIVGIYVGGTLKSGSQRFTQPMFASGAGVGAGTSSIPIPVTAMGMVTTTAGQAIEIRWQTGAGTATAGQKTLNIVRIA